MEGTHSKTFTISKTEFATITQFHSALILETERGKDGPSDRTMKDRQQARDHVLQANSVCNLTRRGFLVRKVYRAQNASLGHSTVKLKLELELELVRVDVWSRWVRVPLFPRFYLPSVPEMTIEIDSWNRCFALDSTETRSNDWLIPATLHHRVVLTPLWSGNENGSCHVPLYVEYYNLSMAWIAEIFERVAFCILGWESCKPIIFYLN